MLFADATAKLGIKSLQEMDPQTQTDMQELNEVNSGKKLPCEPANVTGTLKCEACEGGCQVYDSIDYSLKIANERTHWVVPGGKQDVVSHVVVSSLVSGLADC